MSDVPPVNELDQLCKQHDQAYALGGNLEAADIEFYNSAAQLRDPRGYTYGLIVYHGNRLLRMGNFLAPILYPDAFKHPPDVTYLRRGEPVRLRDYVPVTDTPLEVGKPKDWTPEIIPCPDEVCYPQETSHNPYLDLHQIMVADPLYEHMSVERPRRKRRRRVRRKYMFL